MAVTVTVDAPARGCLTRPARVVVSTPGETVVGSPATAAPWASLGPRDQLVVTYARSTTRLGELNTAQIEDPTWVHCGIGSLRFTIPADDKTALDCLIDPATVDLGVGEAVTLGREVEWWRNGELRWKGVPIAVDFDLDAGTVSYDCPDLGWYLSRRFMGAAERVDLLNDVGQMDRAGLPGWTRDGVTAVRNTTTKVRGVGSAQLTGAGSMWHDFIHDAHHNAVPIAVYATARVRVQEEALPGEFLLETKVFDLDTGAEVLPGIERDVAEVDDETVLDGWNTVTCYSLIPPGKAYRVRVTVGNGPDGTRYYDDVRALKNDTTGITPAEVAAGKGDLTRHGVAILNHGQGALKGSFGFKPVILYPSGTAETLGVRHSEHSQILDLFEAYVNRDDGWEWWIDPRTRRVYFAARQGQDHSDLVLHNGTVIAGGWTQDDSERSSAVVVPGDGDEITRAEGGYTNTSRTGGLVLDHYERPPNGTPLAALDPMAKAVWDRLSGPQVKMKPVKVPGDWWGSLSCGDRLRSEFTCGVFRMPGNPAWFRIGKITHNLDTDLLELT